MLELPERLSRCPFEHGWKVVRLVAIHGANHGYLINRFTHVRKPVRYGNARLAVLLVSSKDWDHRTLHWGIVIAKANRVHDLSGVFIVFRIEGIDMAHAAA